MNNISKIREDYWDCEHKRVLVSPNDPLQKREACKKCRSVRLPFNPAWGEAGQ